ncbi:Serine/threonine-protein kinase rio2 [Microbotryomycetes sp. JL201]|nr:Serine/threonine-protein kinase rio2 [Microbotryomycetes sp. JL201]
MKLDASDLRFLSNDEFRVLSAVEQGSKNHEVVPLALIAQVAGLRSGGVNKALAELAKRRLVAKVQHSKYEGVRLTYGGYDFLACRTFAKRDTVYSVGNQIGTGKESDIYVVADADGSQSVLKIHRQVARLHELGRVSFRTIKSKRDYLRKGQSASWMYMSRLAAMKEFAFMKILHEHGFPVPKPVDQSRHCIVMELIDAFPLRQISSVPNPGSLYSKLMELIVRLARSGLIHGDFNEFNILIRDHRSDEERIRDEDRDDSDNDDDDRACMERDLAARGDQLEPVLIDFPQMVSVDHADAEFYFDRDVDCIRAFFAKRFKYESSLYPKLADIKAENTQMLKLDVAAEASGFTKGDKLALEEHLERGREADAASHSEVSDSENEASQSAEVGTRQDYDEGEQEDTNETQDDVGSESDQNEQDGESDNSERLRYEASASERTTRRTAVDVTAVVTDKLRRTKLGNERKHHGKKPAASGMLGRHRGSKQKQDTRRSIRDADTF